MAGCEELARRAVGEQAWGTVVAAGVGTATSVLGLRHSFGRPLGDHVCTAEWAETARLAVGDDTFCCAQGGSSRAARAALELAAGGPSPKSAKGGSGFVSSQALLSRIRGSFVLSKSMTWAQFPTPW
mmetsp:Transcript_58802/g.164184  ORF Transcript_58802/g.164184 Transcript_58802/m.164184 type:complete len:127 (+) Transcript_58802:1025-1405(+)